MATLAEWGAKGSPLEAVGAAHYRAPRFLPSFADTKIEISRLSQSQRLALTKTRMKICSFISEARLISRVGPFICRKHFFLIIRPSEENELHIRRLVRLGIEWNVSKRESRVVVGKNKVDQTLNLSFLICWVALGK